MSMDQVGTSNTEDTEAGSTVDSARMMDIDATGSEKQLQMLLDSINKKESVLIAKVDNLSVKLDEKKKQIQEWIEVANKAKVKKSELETKLKGLVEEYEQQRKILNQKNSDLQRHGVTVKVLQLANRAYCNQCNELEGYIARIPPLPKPLRPVEVPH